MQDIKELREMTPAELQLAYDESNRELFNLRLQQTMGQLERPSRMRELRRDIARIRTVFTERRHAERAETNHATVDGE